METALTLHDASAPLLSQRFSAPNAFPQSGSWSWGGLIDSGVRGAVKVLSRYSAANVDPYTVVVGQIICGSFKLTASSSQRLSQAILQLSSMGTIGNIVHLGFGIDSVVRNLSATEEGGILVALCGAATECFLDDHAANILWELVRLFKAPSQQTPSPLQWKNLLKACAGVLATTEFPKMAEHFMHLHPFNDQLSVGRHRREIHPNDRGISSPDTMAEALLAIGKVSTGGLVSISIIGGGDAGWLAAVAHWIFDLRIAIMTPDGQLLYANFVKEDQQPQVQVFYIKPYEDRDIVKVVVKGRIFQLRDFTEVLYPLENDLGSSLACSRVPWTSALALTFGADFRRLMKMQRSFGKAISAAASVLEGVAQAAPEVTRKIRRDCQTYFSLGSGRNFIIFTTSLFPELEPLRTFMNAGSFASFETACETYDLSLARIKTGCACSICNSNVKHGMFEDRFCLVLLLESIIAIIICMSGVSNPLSLMPMRSGIESFYRRQMEIHRTDAMNDRIHKYGRVGAILEFDHSDIEDWSVENRAAIRRLSDTARLFSGRDSDTMIHEQIGINIAGIVVFLNAILENGLPIDRESMGLCTVVPGHIEMDGHYYKQVEDLSDFDLVGMDYRNRKEGGAKPDPLLDFSGLFDGFEKVTLVAKEEVESIRIGLSIESGDGARAFILGPAMLTKQVLLSTGLVQCNSRTCKREPAQVLEEVNENVRTMQHQGECKIWQFSGTSLGRMVALMRMNDVEPSLAAQHAIFQLRECLNCCITNAEISESLNALIVSPINSGRRT